MSPARLRRSLAAALLLAALAPPLLAFGVVDRYGVDLLRIDDWSLAWLYTRIDAGTLSLADLTAQHNEIRPLVPRLILIALAELAGYDARNAMWLSLALCCVVAGNLAFVARRTLGGPAWRTPALMALVSALLFSPVNAPNWLWAVQIVMFVTLASLTAGLAIACSRAHPLAKLASAVALASVATYSMSAGLLCWIALPLAYAGQWRGRGLAAWLVAAAAVLTSYFAGYTRPDSLPDPWRALAQPLDLLAYVLSYLGAPFGAHLGADRAEALAPSLACGALLALLLAAACATLARARHDGELRRRCAPWLALAAFSLLCAVLAAVGRSGFGLQQALAVRYATWALLLPIALLGLGAVAFDDARRRAAPPALRRRAAVAAAAIGLALAAAHAVGAVHQLRALPAAREQHLAGRALLAFLNVAPEERALERLVFPWFERLAERARALDRRGLLDPPLVASDRVQALAAEGGGEPHGAIDRHQRFADAIGVAGWAVLPERGEPAHAVLLCAGTTEADARIVAVVTAHTQRPDVVERTGRRRYLRSGWLRRLPLSRLPPGATRLTAWAFDAVRYRAYPLEGSVSLAAEKRGPETGSGELSQQQIEALPGRWHRHQPRPGSAHPFAVRERDREALAALGYAAGAMPTHVATGVLRHDRARASAGLNLYVSGHAPEATLMDMEGTVLHKWGMDRFEALPNYRPGRGGRVANNWRRAHVASNGDLIAIYGGQGMVKLDRHSRLLWVFQGGVHHDLEVLADGTIYTLVRKAVIIARLHATRHVFADYVIVLGPDGRLLRWISLVELMLDSPFAEVKGRMRGRVDVLHANALEVLARAHGAKSDAFTAGNLLVSLRDVDALAVVDMRTGTIPWALSGPWRAQHQPVLLENGNILLFDNSGLSERRSRILEIDPASGDVVWSYGEKDEDAFFSELLGSVQPLPNGNVLITESENGRALEVTRGGEIVWEFVTPHRAGPRGELVASLYELVRLAPDLPRDWIVPETRSLSIDVSETAR